MNQEQAEAIAEEIVDSIVADLSGRSGFDAMFESIDEATRKEMLETWRGLALAQIPHDVAKT